ncbi:4a-hydroxytetrahydrobiopterin dehydratase [Actinoplanes sp. SE50]|uniref:VOC family protein n=1 Tax=unclassified Actinoplanes TaxID=2626549 RepID=UPI00023EC4ED|nr:MULTISPECIES: VOC family protein [unclassified Actinoplanes]AEV86423.1 4a-hydroxytetrahydrobiopterin dehydratase [Actinoplanes sp. SE50/110]ATO84820.1 4a-hydroxytetrahydrobiopterin dehydratase [Actinoplanes sp. SE50]SLM02230.1 4a-hydroxytetrahydrobiopterin dehydratase [Actinoplanes sp. SE50/110]
MDEILRRSDASAAVGELGWRFVLGTLQAAVAVDSISEGAQVLARAVAACGADADAHLRADLCPSRVVLSLQSAERAAVTTRDADLAGRITRAVGEGGWRTGPDLGADGPRSVQLIEIGIDALDIAAIRPFWRAVLGYTDEPGHGDPEDPVVDPLRIGPAIWFQQMDQPRPQRNRIHFDVSVPHDEAPGRIEAALAAGGRLVSSEHAPAFWVLADAEGNEACVTTWQGRD